MLELAVMCPLKLKRTFAQIPVHSTVSLDWEVGGGGGPAVKKLAISKHNLKHNASTESTNKGVN